MSHMEPLVAEFEQHRTHLLGVAYRLTGSYADAEDAVQDAWLRLTRQPSDEIAAIRNLRAWLTSVVGRLSVDRLRSAASVRERYVGTWLPEPLVTPLEGPADPLDGFDRLHCRQPAISGTAGGICAARRVRRAVR